jgi:hypothetical protein
MKSPSPDNGPQHGIQAATYSGGPGEPYFQPIMECCCGFTTERCENWEEAGRQLDRHLVETKK